MSELGARVATWVIGLLERVAALSAAILIAAVLTVPARADEFTATYRATLAGLPIGGVQLSGRMAEGAYSARVDGSVSVLGISNVFDAEAQGSLRQMRLRPTSFRSSSSGRESRRVVVSFIGDRAVQTVVAPEYSETEVSERIPILPDHQEGVIDPVTALVTHSLRAASSGDPCQGTSRIFSGQSRFDVQFRPGTMREGEIVCHATLRPIAGHRRESVGSMRPDWVVLVVFSAAAASPGPRFPLRLELSTPFGNVILQRAS